MEPIPRVTEPIPRTQSVWMTPLSLVDVGRADEGAPSGDGGWAGECEGEERARGRVLDLCVEGWSMLLRSRVRSGGRTSRGK